MRTLSAIALLLVATTTAAQDRVESRSAGELGLRYWLSSGNTKWSHNPQNVDPTLGNPGSILSYEDLVAHSVELYGRKNFGRSWFVRGMAGVGRIEDGTLDDEDYLAGQFKDSDTTSEVQGNRIGYASFDVGRDLWMINRGRTTIGLFAGYHYWTERQDAYGLIRTVPNTGTAFGDSVPMISNEVSWDSLRVGLATSTVLAAKTRIAFDLAWIPYSRFHNEDSHYHRPDLGPVPNINFRGRGQGMQLELEVKHQFRDNWELGFGARYWWMETTHGTARFRNTDTPLINFETQRVGFMASLTRRW